MLNRRKDWLKIGVSAAACLIVPSLAWAQDGSAPLPGGDTGSVAPSPPAFLPLPPAGSMPPEAPARAAQHPQVRPSYAQLPLSIKSAQSRIEELRSLLAASSPQSLQEAVDHMCQWLGDMTDAHNKMAQAFSRHENTKAEAQSEKQMAGRFLQLKNRAELLKADILIKEGRLPEALSPLVAIVVSEPDSETGQDAYRRLKEIGFSEESAPAGVSPSAQGSSAPVSTAPITAAPRIAPAPKWQPKQAAAPAPAAKLHALTPKLAASGKIAPKHK